MTQKEHGLDPEDWHATRQQMHRVLDACLDRMQDARALPWQPVGEAERAAFQGLAPSTGVGLNAVADRLMDDIMPFATGNTHPSFWGWVHGSGHAAGFMAEMVAAAMNANCGGRDHGAVYVERQVVDWCRNIMELPHGAGGLMVTGTSQATLLAFHAARVRALEGTALEVAPPLTAYALEGAHGCVTKALNIMGLGAGALRILPEAVGSEPEARAIDADALRRAVKQDREDGRLPFLLVATAGSVNTGTFDDLNAAARLAEELGLWLHVDAAFGAWTRLADTKWRGLSDGIGTATSIAFDFHKWLGVPYACGMLLVRDQGDLLRAYSGRGAYLEGQAEGLAGGEPWACDLGLDLSRGFTALKVWATIQAYGTDRLGEVVTMNCRQAAQMAEVVAASATFRMAAPVVSNICCFGMVDPVDDWKLAKVAVALQLEGQAVFSTTTIDARPALRAAITNHRTRRADITAAIRAAEEAAKALS
ncbi:MAG: pyridoxal phosphate-dependent decarboxylase family protein [Brevirhabdus sp.]